jgi:hypothetical protein
VACSLLLQKKHYWIAQAPILMFISISLGGLFLYRYSAPFTCCADFRFIQPIVLPMAILVSHAIILFRALGWTWLSAVGVYVAAAFSAVSVLFLINLFV